MIREAIRTTVRGVGVVLLTVVEVTALSVWLGLVNEAALLSTVAAVGITALAAGMLVVGLLTHVTVNGWGRPVPAQAIAVLALIETVLWVGWLAGVYWTDSLLGVVGAGLALAVVLVPRHTTADNVVRGRDPLASLVQRPTIGLAVLEATGATAWFLVVTGTVAVPHWFISAPIAGFSTNAIVGAALLAVATFARNLLGVRHALRVERASRDTNWRSSRGTRPE